MIVLEGKSVFSGIAIGPIALFDKGEDRVKRWSVEDTEAEKSMQNLLWHQRGIIFHKCLQLWMMRT